MQRYVLDERSKDAAGKGPRAYGGAKIDEKES
jgi:hypothetical protein